MNFLAHIHIAMHCDSDVAGNLLGDFVKGNPVGKYPNEVVDGIMLHRFVDKFTDQHEVSQSVKLRFEPERRRFAPIAMDIFWDHCLVNQWSEFSELSIDEFCKIAEMHAQKPNLILPERYLHVSKLMWQNKWLSSYGEMENIRLVLQRMSYRSHRMGPLAHCIKDIECSYDYMKSRFSELYSDVLIESKKKFLSLS